ncbi:MAG: hypothetical protein H0W19_10855, partial [Nitrosopumilus sp.]|nr:hypothetical protein [Nitrosopumilus sp.]
MTSMQHKILKTPWTLSNKVVTNQILKLIMIAVVAFILVDLSLLKFYDLILKDPTSIEKKLLLSCLAAIFIVTQIFISSYINRQNIPFLRIGQFRKIHKIVVVVNWILTCMVLKVIYEIWFKSYYEINSVIVALFLSYGLGMVMTGHLSYKFLIWFKSNHGKTMLLYFFSSALITSAGLFTLVFLYAVLSMYSEIIPTYGGTAMYMSIFQSNALMLTNIFTTVAFITTWLATALLLSYRSHIIGRTKYWFFISLPLIYFLSQFLSVFTNKLIVFFKDDPIFFGMVLITIFTFSKLIGGILFGFAFWRMAKTIATELEVPRNLIRLAGYGYVILLMSTQVVAFSIVPYPPFGLFTILFYGIASYMILVGVYFSVIVISQDSKMRNIIKKATEKEPSLISDISYAQLENVIEKRTMRLVKNIAVEPSSGLAMEQSNFEDLKSYAISVISEIKSYDPIYTILIEKETEILTRSKIFFVCLNGKLLENLRDHQISLLS